MSPDARLWIERLPRRWSRNGALVGGGLVALLSIVPRRYDFDALMDHQGIATVVMMILIGCLLGLISGVVGLRTRAKLRRFGGLTDDDRAAAITRLPIRFGLRLGVVLLGLAAVLLYGFSEPLADRRDEIIRSLGSLAVAFVLGVLIGGICGLSLRGNLRLALATMNATPGQLAVEDETVPTAAMPLSPARSPCSTYLARHWRGELSLPVTYWVNGLLAYLVTALAVVATRTSLDIENDFSPGAGLAAVLLLLSVAIVIMTWQMVGIWRSAANFQRAQKVVWGGAAKVMVVLSVLATAADLGRHEALQIAELYRMAVGDEYVGPHAFRVLRDGQELEFSGGITFGVGKDFERMIDSLPALKVVHLDSQGGRSLEAQRIGDLVRRRNLAIHVEHECSSACTIVFLSGRERTVSPDAKLGFHQPDFPGLRHDERREAIATEHQRLVRLGVSERFAQQAMSAAPDSMWYPPIDDLLREGIATRLASDER